MWDAATKAVGLYGVILFALLPAVLFSAFGTFYSVRGFRREKVRVRGTLLVLGVPTGVALVLALIQVGLTMDQPTRQDTQWGAWALIYATIGGTVIQAVRQRRVWSEVVILGTIALAIQMSAAVTIGFLGIRKL
jgi:hypothetical protein